MATEDWRKGMKYFDRMTANVKLQSAYKKAFPSLSGAEVKSKASDAEASILKEANSLDEYKQLYEAKHGEILAQAVSQPTEDSATAPSALLSPSSEPFQTVGPFQAQYHASGLFSTIYRTTLPATGAVVALKLTTPHRMSAPHDSERETRLLRLAQGKAGVLPLLESRQLAGGHLCLVFPFLPYNLGGLLDEGHLTQPQLRTHLHSLFGALAHVHQLGIIHRDIKPSNLLLAGSDGPARLADFGISWREGDPSAEPADEKITDVGTTCYRAPEVLFGFKGYGTKFDMWAAGCVVAECLRGGRSLFDAGDLGSELALISSMFRTIGTPTSTDWPEAKAFPDWGKMEFRKHEPKTWTDILPDVDADGRDLVSRLVTYESADRLDAEKVLEHPFFKDLKCTQ